MVIRGISKYVCVSMSGVSDIHVSHLMHLKVEVTIISGHPAPMCSPQSGVDRGVSSEEAVVGLVDVTPNPRKPLPFRFEKFTLADVEM